MAILTGKINFHCSISVWLAKFLDSSMNVNVCNISKWLQKQHCVVALIWYLGIGVYDSVCKAI